MSKQNENQQDPRLQKLVELVTAKGDIADELDFGLVEAQIEELLDEGINFSAKDQNCQTALQALVKHGSENTVELLLSKVDDVKDMKDALRVATQEGFEGIVDKILGHLDVIGNGDDKDYYGELVLEAAREGHAGIVRALCEYDANIADKKDQNESSVLMIAAGTGDVDVVKAVLEAGKSKEIFSEECIAEERKDIEEALVIAARLGYEDIIQKIIASPQFDGCHPELVGGELGAKLGNKGEGRSASIPSQESTLGQGVDGVESRGGQDPTGN